MASRAHITIEQIDNGYLVDAIEEDISEGVHNEARFCVPDAMTLLAVLSNALIRRSEQERDTSMVEDEEPAEWPEGEPTLN